MTEPKSGKSGTILLTLASLLWGGLGIVCIGLSFFFIAFYDSPIDPEAGLGISDYTLIGSVLAFPIFCLISSLGIWFLKNRSKGLATILAILPIIPLSFFVFFFTRSDSSFMKDSQNITLASECEPSTAEIEDGLETGQCGSLQVGNTVSGTLNSTSEAHNWQFSAEQSPMQISIENDDTSCPHIVILDANGNVVDGFEDENDLRLCLSGLTTTGFYQFVPPRPGMYIIRVFSPEAAGSYWLKIE